jgi:fido (protein-threonine AMPylation protein)
MARVVEAVIAEELRRVTQILQESVTSLNRQAIAAAYRVRYAVELPQRTLQRRLERLIVEGRIRPEGGSRSTTYRHASAEGLPPLAGTTQQLSAQGVRLRDLVRRPLRDREPVGYEIEWLRSYRPGTTWYLSKADRAQLREVGRTPDDDRPGGTFARDILGRLLIDLSWASSRLEGNTYTRLDTQNLLEFGQAAEGKDASETQMILNHKAAIEYIVDIAGDETIRPADILTLHALLSENLLDDVREEGRLRERPVEIGGSSYTPTAIPQTITEAFQRIVDTLNAIPDPFEQALFAMAHLAYLQPFIDVNKRTSRLLANLCLIRANMCPLSFVGADEVWYVLGTLAVYEQRRTELLRDFFLPTYAQSAAKYRVVKGSAPTPDPVRLRYRDQLREAVRATVTDGLAPNATRILELAARLNIPQDDRERFTDLAMELLFGLNVGSAARYGLRPSEFQSWSENVRVASPTRRPSHSSDGSIV